MSRELPVARSRFTRSAKVGDGEEIVYNAYTGAIAVASPDVDSDAELAEAGFAVASGTDERENARLMHEALQASKSRHLVIMPTEACNLRCTYCYQTFSKGAMSRETIEGLKACVQGLAPRADRLAVSWFGGEPLLAYEAIVELSDSFMKSCEVSGIAYAADMSTNGYLLTLDRFVALLDRQVRRFMITLDGLADVHDRRRKQRMGGRTFDTIARNLLALRQVDAEFAVDIRVNFDEHNADTLPELLEKLGEWFGGDGRFQLLVRPVGRWGGPQDERIPVCDRTTADSRMWGFAEEGLKRGLALSESVVETLMPSGAVCYAAKPQSLVIGSDGRLYKCSIALDDEMNQVGRLHPDGRLELDENKIAMWTSGGEEVDEGCRTCFFRPACQGNHCPLYRIRTGKRPCPHEKRQIKRVLQLLWKNDQLGFGRREGS